MRLQLKVRRFYCNAADCSKVTFAERLGEAIETYARRTSRLNQKLLELVLALGGKAGARLAKRCLVKISSDSLLRLIYQLKLPPIPTPKVLSVDDFAWRRVQR